MGKGLQELHMEKVVEHRTFLTPIIFLMQDMFKNAAPETLESKF